MRALFTLFALFLAFSSIFSPLSADPGDVTAASRGVVRVVLIGQESGQLVPVTHGSGFAVSPTRIVTNAHVLREAMQDTTLRIGVVPSQGENSTYARIVAVSPRNDLALIEITGSALRLPPLTLAGGHDPGAGEVVAVGYPMNVDLAQGLSIGDIFRAQPPVKSRGFLSGERPSRQFDTILHTAPIARGNSGGPLLDGCGRVVGVNSFSADSGDGGAEFFFAVSLRELIPFLRAQGIEPQVNTMPCRSIDELNTEERARLAAEQEQVRERLAQREAALREAREEARLTAQMEVIAARENSLVIALALIVAAAAAGYAALQWRSDPDTRPRAWFAAGLALVGFIGAVLVWATRPGVAAIEEKVAEAMAAQDPRGAPGGASSAVSIEGTLICTLIPERSRVTSARTDDVELEWSSDGCVNARTQYGRTNQGEWSRVFVPDDEDAVAVNTYDPATRTFRTERYLLGAAAMTAAREARRQNTAPACGVSEAARLLGEQQSALLAQLPNRPNERLVYACAPKP
jgi:serine protease Do